MRFPKLLSAFVVAAFTACGGGEKNATPAAGDGASPAATKGAQAASVLGDPGAHVERFQFGDATGANGVVVKETSVIPRGSTAALSLVLSNAPAGTRMRVVWNDLGKKAAVGEEVKVVGDKGFVAFQHPKPLPAGSYRVTMSFKPPGFEVWQDAGSHDFKVEGKI